MWYNEILDFDGHSNIIIHWLGRRWLVTEKPSLQNTNKSNDIGYVWTIELQKTIWMCVLNDCEWTRSHLFMISMTLPIYSNNIRYVPPPPLKQLEPPRKYTIKNTKPECMQEKVHIPLCRGEMILFIKDTLGNICLLIITQ